MGCSFLYCVFIQQYVTLKTVLLAAKFFSHSCMKSKMVAFVNLTLFYGCVTLEKAAVKINDVHYADIFEIEA